MANEQVRIDLTADDKASRTIDDVADDVEALEKLDPEVTIVADDKASADLADVADRATALDRLDPEVTIVADDKASADIASVRDDAEALARVDAEIVLRAKVDAAKADLASLQAELKTTGERAEDTARQLDRVDKGGGSNLRGNAIADLTGPLGEASGAASDFAGVFDGLADISEGVASKVGLSAEQMAGAIGGIGVAVAAGAAAWTYFRQKQEEARRRQRELTDAAKEFLDAYRTGNIVQATDKLVGKWEDMLNLADRLGVSIEDVTAVLTGQASTVPGLTEKVDAYRTVWEETNLTNAEARDAALDQYEAYRKLAGMVDDAADATARGTSELNQHDRVAAQVESSLTNASRASSDFASSQEAAKRATQDTNDALDRMRGKLDIDQLMINFQRDFADAVNTTDETMLDSAEDVLGFKQTVLDVGTALKQNPLEISAVMHQIDEGDLRGAKSTVESWYARNPVQVATQLKAPPIFPGAMNNYASQTVVNMTLPAGWRGDPVRTAHAQRRRVGRYFARTA